LGLEHAWVVQAAGRNEYKAGKSREFPQ